MEQAVIGFIGVIVGVIVTYILNHKNNRKNIVYEVLLEQYHTFIKLKEQFDYDMIDLEIYKIKDMTCLDFMNEENRDFLSKEINKTFESFQKTYADIGAIKKHLLNNQYILEHNAIEIENIIKLTDYQCKQILVNEIMNYKYKINQFNLDLLLRNEQEYFNFISNFSKLFIELKVKMEQLLFKEKICYSFANLIRKYFTKLKSTK